jgi:hypothetical protein
MWPAQQRQRATVQTGSSSCSRSPNIKSKGLPKRRYRWHYFGRIHLYSAIPTSRRRNNGGSKRSIAKPAKVLANWDNPLPSDIALKLSGDAEPTILISDRAEVQQAGFERQNDHPILFSDKLKKAHEYLLSKRKAVGAIEDGGGTQFFEIRDGESNVIEICEEP